jgi:MFS family permease
MQYYVKIALQHLAFGLILPISIIWKIQNGLSVPEAVLTESIVLLVTALADLPAGFIANVINNKRSLLLGAVLHFIGMALLFVGGSLGVFIASAVITGIAWAFVSGADEAYLHDDFIEDKSAYRKHFSNVTIVDEVFTIAGMLITSLVIALDGDLRLAFGIASALLLVHLVYTWRILPPGKAPLPGIASEQTTGSLFSLHIFKRKEILAIIPLMVAFAVIYEAGRPLWQPHMQDIGISIASFGLIFALFKLASIGGSLAARGRHFSRFGLAVVFAVMAVSLVAFGSSIKVLSIIALCAFLFTENYFRVYMSTTLNKVIQHNRAAVLSFGSVIRNSAGALIVAGLGFLSSASILLALVVLVLVKVPAMAYALWAYDRAKAQA